MCRACVSWCLRLATSFNSSPTYHNNTHQQYHNSPVKHTLYYYKVLCVVVTCSCVACAASRWASALSTLASFPPTTIQSHI